jgi:hypothetical protein
MEPFAAQAEAIVPDRVPAVNDYGVEELFEQIRELEAARRTDLEALQRAQASLANTQLELFEAQRKLRDAEARIAGLQSGASVVSAPPEREATPASEPAPYEMDLDEPELGRSPAFEPPAYTRMQREEPAPEPAHEYGDDRELSFRERLTRAANQRHSRGN